MNHSLICGNLFSILIQKRKNHKYPKRIALRSKCFNNWPTAPKIYILIEFLCRASNKENILKIWRENLIMAKNIRKKKKKKWQPRVSYSSPPVSTMTVFRSAFAEEMTEYIYTDLACQHAILPCQTIFWRSVPCSVNINGPEYITDAFEQAAEPRWKKGSYLNNYCPAMWLIKI